MQTSKLVNIDPDGIVTKLPDNKEPVKILERIEELRVLSAVADAGLLSSAEELGVFSKLEAAGAFSSAEKLLPLADDLKLLSTAESLLNYPASNLFFLAVAILGAEAGLIYAIPDTSAPLVALQATTGVLAGLASVTLIAISYLFGLLQGDD